MGVRTDYNSVTGAEGIRGFGGGDGIRGMGNFPGMRVTGVLGT